MDFKDLEALFKKGAALLTEGRDALGQVKAAITDGSAAINATQLSQLQAMLDKEEQETKAAIADARDAIAEYRRGG